MCRFTAAVLIVCTLALPTTAQAPARQPARAEDPHALVRGWYRQFLDREPDPAGLTNWVKELAAGTDPAAVLATILASDEYYLRAGRSPQGFAREVLVDLTGREPDPQELRQWARQAGRPEERHALALDILKRHSQALLPPADPAARDFLGIVQERTRVLATELERLQEDVVAELGGQQERELYRRADAVLGDVRHFQRSLRAGADRQHLAKDFGELDRKLHALLGEVRAVGPAHRALQRAAHRVEQADQQLHAALAHRPGGAEPARAEVKRQTHALLAEAREFERTARYALANDRAGAHAEKSVREFARALEHFHTSLDQGEGKRHLREDYAAVDKAWAHVVEHLNALPPAEGHRHLRGQARRLDALEEEVRRLVGAPGERGRVIIQYGRPR